MVKVYVVTPDFSGAVTWVDATRKTAQLDAEIQKLAKQSGAPVHMHEYETPADGAPGVLVEAPDSFIEKVKRLPLFGSIRLLRDSDPPTIRRSNAPQIEPPESCGPGGCGPCGPCGPCG